MSLIPGEMCELAERYRRFPAESVQKKSGYQGDERLLNQYGRQPLTDFQRERQGLRVPESTVDRW